MSYAIIRNTNYKMKNLSGIYRHNERKNTNYSNKDINKHNSKLNYSLKKPYSTYGKIFNDIKEKYSLKGMIKSVSNVMCEFVITSDKDFFEEIGELETKRYFETAYKFVANYQNLGEEFIVSAKVHMDESTPHMHIVFIPVIHTKDKDGKEICKIACSEYWKGKDSYRKLQDNFYSYITKEGFNLERGNTENNKHIDTEKLKEITNYELQKLEEQAIQKEEPILTNDIGILKEENTRVIRKYNSIANQYAKVKNNIYTLTNINQKLQYENNNLKTENVELKNKNIRLKNYIDKTLEYVSILFDFSKERLKNLVNTYINKINEREK